MRWDRGCCRRLPGEKSGTLPLRRSGRRFGASLTKPGRTSRRAGSENSFLTTYEVVRD